MIDHTKHAAGFEDSMQHIEELIGIDVPAISLEVKIVVGQHHQDQIDGVIREVDRIDFTIVSHDVLQSVVAQSFLQLVPGELQWSSEGENGNDLKNSAYRITITTAHGNLFDSVVTPYNT